MNEGWEATGWKEAGRQDGRTAGRRSRRAWLGGCVLLVSAIVGCGAPPREVPATTASATRVVSLVPAATEMLYAIGAGPDVVAVSSFDRFPAEVADLPRVGALIDPDFERILSLRPTLVVVYESQDDLIARLDRARIPVFHYRHAVTGALAQVTDTMRQLGDALDRTAGAETAAATIERELDDVRRAVGARTRPLTALVFGREPGELRGIYASGGVGFLHELLETAGGQDAFADIPRESVQVSTEMLLARRPDVLIELRTSAGEAGTVDAERAVWNRLSALPAVRDRRVHVLTDPSLSIPGPRIAQAARTLFTLLHE